MGKFYIKLVAVLTIVLFVILIMPDVSGAQFFFKPRRGGGSSPSGEIGVRIPFGEGSKPENENVIDRLKEEQTQGAGALIGLIVLGACIVGAAVVIANKADDVKENVIEKAEEIKEDIEEKFEEVEDKYDEIENEYDQ